MPTIPTISINEDNSYISTITASTNYKSLITYEITSSTTNGDSNLTTSGLDDTHFLKVHLIESVPYFRFLMMGIGLLVIMRYRPKGILPEKIEIK